MAYGLVERWRELDYNRRLDLFEAILHVTYRFSEEHNPRLHQAFARRFLTPRDPLCLDNCFVFIIRKFISTINTTLRGKASMSFNYLLFWYTSSPLKGVDILCEASMKKIFLCKQTNKGMSERRSESSRCQFLGQGKN